MHLKSYLVLSRHGVYYLRYQRHGVDRRISLKTKDGNVARSIAYLFGSMMSKISIDKFKHLLSNNDLGGFSKLEINEGDFSLKTDGSREDNEAGIKAYQIFKESQQHHSNPQVLSPSNINSISLAQALNEYLDYLSKQSIAQKSISMARSTLQELNQILGPDFQLNQLDDVVIEKRWVKHCQEIKKNGLTTIKRNLSFIKKFTDWANKPAQNYLNKKITFTIEGAKSEHWEYWDKDDLKLIFDNLINVEYAWKFWIPLIGLYTGARIGEICAMKVADIYIKSDLDIMHLPGTKTVNSSREIPIHPELIRIGLLEYTKYRKQDGNEMLFDISVSKNNGYGGNVSKWFSRYIRDLGITHESKTFSSFRHTITDHLNQMQSSFDANCQYTGHSKGGGVKGQTYGRKLLSLSILKQETIDKVNWLTYCGWSPNLNALKAKANTFL